MKEHNSIIDVLLPHYNDIDGLRLTLHSIAAQTWRGAIRIVVCDDGSGQTVVRHVRALCEEICDDSRLTYHLVQNPENRGRPYTRNVLLDSIDSPYVAWIDSGDEWYARKIELQLSRLYEELACGETQFWVTCDYDWQWIGGKKLPRQQNIENDNVKKLFIGSQFRAYLWTIIAPAGCIKSVGWFDEKLTRLQDLDFFLRFAMSGGRFVKPHNAGPLCVYHKSDMGRDAGEIRRCNYYIFEKFFPILEGFGEIFSKNRKYNAEKLAARIAINNKKYLYATGSYLRAFACKPKGFVSDMLR